MAKSKVDQAVKEDVDVEVTGGFRAVAVAVEGTPISLRPKSGTFSGSKKNVELEPPAITMTATLKGGMLAKYDIAVTINGVTKHSKGKVRNGIEDVKENWSFKEFQLPKGEDE